MKHFINQPGEIFKNRTFSIYSLLMVVALTIGSTAATAQPKPNEPLAQGWIYSPTFKAPAPYQKFDLTPGLIVKLDVEIPVWKGPTGGKFDFVAYSKASSFTEKWHIEIVKQGPDGKEVSLQSFEGLVTGYQFSLPLNADWFKKHGSGKYGAKAYLSQTTSQGKVTGLATGRGFEINTPTVKMSDQKPADAIAAPPKAVVPPQKPTTR
jgi:hypothetical protein